MARPPPPREGNSRITWVGGTHVVALESGAQRAMASSNVEQLAETEQSMKNGGALEEAVETGAKEQHQADSAHSMYMFTDAMPGRVM